MMSIISAHTFLSMKAIYYIFKVSINVRLLIVMGMAGFLWTKKDFQSTLFYVIILSHQPEAWG